MPVPSLYFPPFSAESQAFFRVGAGLLLLVFLGFTAFQFRRYFVSDRWGGYAASTPLVDLLQNPWTVWVVWAVWIGCGAALVIGFQTIAAAFVNLLLCRYFFVHMRWKGILRGGGAPGFLTYWLAAAVFLLELGLHADPGGTIRPVALLALKLDMALIMLSAGVYKSVAGYPRNNGMEFGMVNPFWGYWWTLYSRLSPGHWLFRTLNHLAWATEVVAAILMMIPATQFWGALLLFVSFAWIATQIRLGVLCEMVMLSCLLYVSAGSPPDRWMAAVVQGLPRAVNAVPSLGPGPAAVFRTALWGYILLLPLAHLGLFYNFLAGRRLPRPLQVLLERYTNFFGIIIWRVFTTDVVNFYTRIFIEDPGSGEAREYTEFRHPSWTSRFRYWHVCEYVALASVFTTLKYYASNRALFEERLLRYARTLPCPPGRRILFRYVSLRKTPAGFEHRPAAEFRVDPEARTVLETTLAPEIDLRASHPDSPVREGVTPGSYVPALPSEAGTSGRPPRG